MSARILLLSLATALLATTTLWVGCGGTDPLTALQGSPVYPLTNSIGLPLPSTNVGFTEVLPYTGATPYLTFYGFSLQTQIVSPVTGLVSYVNATATPSQINIVLNSHLTLILTGPTPTVVAGTFVAAGTAIATMPLSFSGFRLTMQVNEDGNPICPMSFLTSAARSAILNVVGGSFNLCTG